MKQRIGIIGLGLVGSALSAKLTAAGNAVSGYDIAEGQVRKFAEAGGNALESASAVAAACELVFLSLPTLKDSRSVVDEILPQLPAGATVVDTTTGSPEESVALAARLAAAGVNYMETLIGGSSTLVRAGEAMAMCGGEEPVYRGVEPMLRTCFRNVFYLGACGNGSRMKLVLNLVLGLNRAVLAEGLAFAAACGLNPAEALAILRASPAHSGVMDTKGRRMVERDFEPEARLSQHLKDVRLILALGQSNGARLPLSALHRGLLEEVEKAGFGGEDNSAVIRAFLDRSAQ